MAEQTTTHHRVNTGVAVAAFIISVISLYFSWQANQREEDSVRISPTSDSNCKNATALFVRLPLGLFRRTRSPCRVPLLEKLDQLGDGIGSRLPPRSRCPAPVDQHVILDVLGDRGNVLPAAARRVLDLRAD